MGHTFGNELVGGAGLGCLLRLQSSKGLIDAEGPDSKVFLLHGGQFGVKSQFFPTWASP